MKKKSMAVVIITTCDTQCAVGGLTVVDVDPSPELVSLDFLHGCCCSYSGGASDSAATDEDNNNDAVSSSDVVGIFIDVVVIKDDLDVSNVHLGWCSFFCILIPFASKLAMAAQSNVIGCALCLFFRIWNPGGIFFVGGEPTES